MFIYDNTKYSISVVKLKDSDLDTYKKSVFCVKCFNYYVGLSLR
jgi:hypothetical protein